MFKLNLFPWRRGVRCAMTSMGGVGSTALGRHINSFADKTEFEHGFSPSVYEGQNPVMLGYMYGNPYNSILSIFRRKYQQMHVEAMHINSGTQPAKLKGVSLEEYLSHGIDEFFLERQFDNWTNQDNVKVPTILIKYEELEDNIDTILDFFQCKKPFAVKMRKSAWEEQPQEIQDGLVDIYGGFKEKVDAMPGVKILYPST